MSEKTTRSSSIDKALLLLNCFTEKRFNLTLEDLAKQTGIPRSTIFRMLTSLESAGYVKRIKLSNKTWYSLGYAFLEKGLMVHRNLDIREYARESMMALRNELNLNVQLAIQDRLDALYIEQIQSWRPIRLYPSIGRRAPLYAAACPRVLLAYLDEAEQNRILEQSPMKQFTPNTPTDLHDIKNELKKITIHGFSYSYGELFEGTIALAVPVFYPDTKYIIAALSIVGLESDFEEDQSYYISKLKEAALEISGKIKQ
ncbi:IclR family transcriptional regulator [Oceanobacillus halotolerans]|uniref:IclR family transcriptional regulator n=1 Tax=Oceanobacillus halotolerans TaxID=2663380 RepID=UPI0013DCEAB2|nr:IclR family transcriptional regulator [Oceanobacillus halotolerans]